MADTARLVAFALRQIDSGTPGYTIENAFGQSIQVLPRTPGFRATLAFEWEGAMPDEIKLLVDRARALGFCPDGAD